MEKYKFNKNFKLFYTQKQFYIESSELVIEIDEKIFNFLKELIFNPNPISKDRILSKINYKDLDILINYRVLFKDWEPNISKVFHEETSMGKNYFPWELSNKAISKLEHPKNARISVRNFSLNMNKYNFHYQNIIKILNRCYGEDFFGSHRGIPSAGGIYPLNIYLIRKEKTHWQLLKYNSSTYKMMIHSSILNIDNFFIGKDLEYSNVPFYLLITYSPEKGHKKYGDRAYRFALLEAGMLAQNFNNLIIKEQLGMINLGSYVEYLFEKNVLIDEWLIHCIGLGEV